MTTSVIWVFIYVVAVIYCCVICEYWHGETRDLPSEIRATGKAQAKCTTSGSAFAHHGK